MAGILGGAAKLVLGLHWIPLFYPQSAIRNRPRMNRSSGYIVWLL